MQILLFIVTYKASYRVRKVINEIPIVTRYGNERSSTHLNYAIRFFLNQYFQN